MAKKINLNKIRDRSVKLYNGAEDAANLVCEIYLDAGTTIEAVKSGCDLATAWEDNFQNQCANAIYRGELDKDLAAKGLNIVWSK